MAERDATSAVTSKPPKDMRCCANCKHWHIKEYIHCQCSGPWGGDIQGDQMCTFELQKTPQERRKTLASKPLSV